MSYKLFRQCLSPAAADPEVEAAGSIDAQTEAAEAPGASSPESPKLGKQRSVLSAVLSLFRSEHPASKASTSQQQQQQQQEEALSSAPAADGPAPASTDATGKRRRQQQRPRRPAPNSSMKLKRDRCPKCHGVLPVTSPELPPVLVKPGQGRRRREYKEDSGCIMAERPAGAHGSDRRSARPVGSQEDSGNYSGSSTGNNPGGPELPHLLPNFYSLRTGYSTCVPRIPNREAPMNFVPIRR